jgi:hypothetical protein
LYSSVVAQLSGHPASFELAEDYISSIAWSAPSTS